MPVRLYAQSCGACGRRWVYVTAGAPDAVCPYCDTPGALAVVDPSWPPPQQAE